MRRPRNESKNKLALWSVTPNGRRLAEKLARELGAGDLYFSERIADKPGGGLRFGSLSRAVAQQFHRYQGHIFIMSAGIVVRVIAALLRGKTADPAVVVVDEQAVHAISLLSGHIGGANRLTKKVARILDARAVITTATDLGNVPAIDMLALEYQLAIENPAAIKSVNMALLQKERIHLHDPFGILQPHLPSSIAAVSALKGARAGGQNTAAVFIDDVVHDLPPDVLVLRPASLAVGIGCNRGTAMEEIRDLLEAVFAGYQLSMASIKALASIDLKSDEPGLQALAAHLERPVLFFTRAELNAVTGIQRPSPVVEKHVGVQSVCEAAAILAAGDGSLIVPKQTNPNATVAVARIDCSSWESDRATPST